MGDLGRGTCLDKVYEIGEEVLGVLRETDLDLSGSEGCQEELEDTHGERDRLTKDQVEGGMNSVTG